MFVFRSLLVILSFSFLAPMTAPMPASAQALFIQLSDAHSAYDRLPNFLKSVEVLVQDYRQREPRGQVLFIVNGDYSGLSPYASENGWLGIKTLEHLTRWGQVYWTPGNHDAFDWSGPRQGNRLAEDHIRRLHQTGVHVLAANIEFAANVRSLAKPHHDLSFANGRKIRLLGLGLDNFFVKSNWSPDPRSLVIESVEPAVPALSKALARATNDKISGLILFQHQGIDEMKKTLQAVTVGSSAPAAVKIPLAFAAHDHRQTDEQVGETRLIDSRSNFDFSTVEMTDTMLITHSQFYDQTRQERTAERWPQLAKHDPVLGRWIDTVRGFIVKAEQRNNDILATTQGFQEIKLTLKDGPNRLGVALAESLKNWLLQNWPATAPQQWRRLPIFAMYNSSSYRRDEPIPAGELTRGTIISFYPFPGHVMAFLSTHEEVQAIYQELRAWRLKEDSKYTPQVSENLREGPSLQLIHRETGRELRRDPQAPAILVLDSWLSRNGYNLPRLKNFLDRHEPILEAPHIEVLEKNAPLILTQFSPPRPGQLKMCRDVHRWP